MSKKVILVTTNSGYLNIIEHNSESDALESMIHMRSEDLLDYAIIGKDKEDYTVVLRKMKR